jgi:hypothetical protein
MESKSYDIQFVVSSNSADYDLSSYVNEITIKHSIKLIEPIFIISVQLPILRALGFRIDSATLVVSSYMFSNEPVFTYTYNLLPATYYADAYNNNQSAYPDQSTVNLGFKVKECYLTLSHKVPTITALNTNLPTVLSQIAPNNVNYMFTPNLNRNSYEQIFIPTQSFLGALKYINKWFSYYPGATSITIHPDKEIANVVIRDNNYLSKHNMSDLTIYNVLPMQSDSSFSSQLEKQYSDPKVLVTNLPAVYKSNVPNSITQSNFRLTTIPRAKLYTDKTLNISQFINKYGIVGKSFNINNENSLHNVNNSIQLINHYVGYDQSIDCYTSDKGLELSYMTKVGLIFNMSPKFGSVWAGLLFNLVINDPDTASYAGPYLIDSVTYSLRSDQTVSWICNIGIEGIRSNLNQY